MKKVDPTQLRETQLACYVTPADARFIKDFAHKAGFRSTSQLMTAILERLVIGRFSPMVFLKIGLQIQKYAEANGAPYEGKPYWGVRQLPALPDEGISQEELEKQFAKASMEMLDENQPPIPAI